MFIFGLPWKTSLLGASELQQKFQRVEENQRCKEKRLLLQQLKKRLLISDLFPKPRHCFCSREGLLFDKKVAEFVKSVVRLMYLKAKD